MYKVFLVLILSMLFLAGCGDNAGLNTNGAEPTIKENVKPVADAEIAVIEFEEAEAFPAIKIELYSNIAPKHVERFKKLASEGFYNGVKVHRINQDVIQTGDPNSKDNDPSDDGQGGSELPDLPAEFSDIKYVDGIVGAARSPSSFDSANSQFFIMKGVQPGFDRKYTVFGNVIEGMGTVRTIGGAPAAGERPTSDIVIKTIKIQKK